jgi:hypothetical protein
VASRVEYKHSCMGLNCPPGGASHEGGFAVLVLISRAAGDAEEVATAGVDDDREVGKSGVGVALLWEREGSQRGISPPQPQETRMGCTVCCARA